MLPFPEFGTMPPPTGAVPPAPEAAGTGGGFASALQAMFERVGLDGEAQVGEVAASELSLRETPGDVGKPVRAATVEAGPDVGAEQNAVAGLPVAGLWVRLERVEPVSVETAGEGQEAVQGEQKDGPTQDESPKPLATGRMWEAIQVPEARVTEAGTDQEQSWAERTADVNRGRVDMARRVAPPPVSTPDEFAEVEPQSPARLQEPGRQKEARVELRPAAAQHPLPQEEPQSQASLKDSGSTKELSVEAERNSVRHARQPAGPDSESGFAMVAARRDGAAVDVRPADRARVTEETQDSVEVRVGAERRVRPPAGLVELKRPQIWGSVAKDGTDEDPVAFSLKAGMRGERAEGRPNNGRGEERAVGKLTEVERLADGSAQGTRPEVQLRREVGRRLETDRPATGIVRDVGDATDHRGPGSRGERATEARPEVKSGDTAALVRPVMESAGGRVQSGVEAGGNSGELVAASTLGGRIEGQVNVKQVPAASPSSPAIRVEAAVDELQEARGAIREIRMTVEPERGKPIRLQFKENGGQVEVTARSGDPATAAALRADLGGLRSLGYETVRGVGGLAGPELAAKPEAESGGRGEGGSQESPGHGNPGAREDASREHKGRNAARWLEAFDRQRDGEWHKEKGEKQ